MQILPSEGAKLERVAKMLNLKMTAKAMPHADDADARREEFEGSPN